MRMCGGMIAPSLLVNGSRQAVVKVSAGALIGGCCPMMTTSDLLAERPDDPALNRRGIPGTLPRLQEEISVNTA